MFDFFFVLFYRQEVIGHIDVYTSFGQVSVVLTLGLCQILSIGLCMVHPGLMSTLLLFVSMGLLLPGLVLVLPEAAEISLSNQKWTQLTAALVVSVALFLTGQQRMLKTSAVDMLATKVILLFQALMIVEAAGCLSVDLIEHQAGR